MKKSNAILLSGLFLLFTACSEVTSTSGNDNSSNDSDWLIPNEQVINGGVPKDGIPSIDAPKFKPTNEIEYVNDERLITGVRHGDIIKGYPHQVMDHHEIANDQFGDLPVCFTYCPLTGTGIAFERLIDGEPVEFGVSGLLFRNNLIPYDRKTGTNYSQMQMRGVQGPRKGERFETLPVFQTKWSTWKKLFPEAQVLTTETGYNRDYSIFLYGEDYLEEDTPPLFPLTVDDKIIDTYKKREYIVIEKNTGIDIAATKIYTIEDFGSGISLERGEIGDTEYVVAGSSDLDFAIGFERELNDGTTLNFEPVQDELPVIMKDQEGNRWDILGRAVDGPRQGEQLTHTLSYYGYEFAFGEFFKWN